MSTSNVLGREITDSPWWISCALVRVISGGQTGVDIAALRAARACGLSTGGWIPCRFRTLAGPRPGYAAEFGLRETVSRSYVSRTHANVRDSDATLRLAVNLNSPGERCTWDAIVRHRRRYRDVALVRPPRGAFDTVAPYADVVVNVVRWIVEGGWTTLNVAGNSETTAPGIEAFAEGLLTDVFRMVCGASRSPLNGDAGEPVSRS